MLKYLPSHIAASAVYLALKTMGAPCWVRTAPRCTRPPSHAAGRPCAPSPSIFQPPLAHAWHCAQGPELTQHSCYSEAALLPCVREINALHKAASTNNLQAVRKKYAQEKHGAVSGITPTNV